MQGSPTKAGALRDALNPELVDIGSPEAKPDQGGRRADPKGDRGGRPIARSRVSRSFATRTTHKLYTRRSRRRRWPRPQDSHWGPADRRHRGDADRDRRRQPECEGVPRRGLDRSKAVAREPYGSDGVERDSFIALKPPSSATVASATTPARPRRRGTSSGEDTEERNPSRRGRPGRRRS